jgi:hypothetical protein
MVLWSKLSTIVKLELEMTSQVKKSKRKRNPIPGFVKPPKVDLNNLSLEECVQNLWEKPTKGYISALAFKLRETFEIKQHEALRMVAHWYGFESYTDLFYSKLDIYTSTEEDRTSYEKRIPYRDENRLFRKSQTSRHRVYKEIESLPSKSLPIQTGLDEIHKRQSHSPIDKNAATEILPPKSN